MPSSSVARGLSALHENGSEGKGKPGFFLQMYGEQGHQGPPTFTSSQEMSFIPRSVTRSRAMNTDPLTGRAYGEKADHGRYHSNTRTTGLRHGDAVGTEKARRRKSSTTQGCSIKKSLSSSIQKASRNTAVIVWLVFTLMAAMRLWKCRVNHRAAHHPVPSSGESTAGRPAVRRLAEGGSGGGHSPGGQRSPSRGSREEEAGPSRREDPTCSSEEMTLERLAASAPRPRPERTGTFTITNRVNRSEAHSAFTGASVCLCPLAFPALSSPRNKSSGSPHSVPKKKNGDSVSSLLSKFSGLFGVKGVKILLSDNRPSGDGLYKYGTKRSPSLLLYHVNIFFWSRQIFVAHGAHSSALLSPARQTKSLYCGFAVRAQFTPKHRHSRAEVL